MQNKSKKVFVSYSREDDTPSHCNEILAFVNLLRAYGYDAKMDEFLLGEHSSPNLFRMMAEQIERSDKVILILSKSYKRKADLYKGGVGFEVERIMPDLRENPNKYIFLAFWNEEELPYEYIKQIQPFAFNGHMIYPINEKGTAIDRIVRKLSDIPEWKFREVAPELYLPQGNEIVCFMETQRKKKSDKFLFSNLHIHTILRFEDTGTDLSYEVFRCLKVTSRRLPDLQIRPQFYHKSSVHLSSYLVNLPEVIEMDDRNFAKFIYPLPPNNKFGDILQIHYKMNLKYPNFNENNMYYTLSENDSQFEIHEVVLGYTENAPDARLLKKRKTDLIETVVQSIEFDPLRRSYRFVLVNPELDCTYILRW